MSVHKKTQEARIKLQGSVLKKSGLNKFAGFQYFELGDFLPTVQAIFNEVGLSSTMNFTATEATLMLIDTEDNSFAMYSCPVVIPSMKGCNEVQALGAMMTYIRRYLYVNALEIVEHDIMDATTGQEGKGKGVHKPTDNPAFNPDEEEVKFLSGIVAEIISAENDPAAASAKFYGSGLDNDEQTYIWNALGKYSALRRAMKEHNAALLKKESI